jgi:peptidoglycan/LPS O-acetylase OafA/YrhL
VTTLAERSRSRDNNFDVLRLAAAVLVLVAHSWALTGRAGPTFPGAGLVVMGVPIFFAISGFLIARSWHLDPRAGAFVVKRVLRLWPALLVVLVFSAFVLGAAVTDRTLGDYFSSPKVTQYLIDNARLHTTFILPGVFDHNPGSDGVNGSLWTLPAEVKAYAIVLALGVAGLLRRPLMVLAVLTFVIWMLVGDGSTRPYSLAHALGSPDEIQFIAYFVGAALLFSLRERVPLDWRLGLAAAAALWLTNKSGVELKTAAWVVALPYLIVFLAYSTPAWLRVAVRPGDLSYGIYIWAFPVQQTIMWADGSLSPVALLALAAPITYALAYGSWHLVEAPALRLKRRLPVRGAARSTPAVDAQAA